VLASVVQGDADTCNSSKGYGINFKQMDVVVSETEHNRLKVANSLEKIG